MTSSSIQSTVAADSSLEPPLSLTDHIREALTVSAGGGKAGDIKDLKELFPRYLFFP